MASESATDLLKREQFLDVASISTVIFESELDFLRNNNDALILCVCIRSYAQLFLFDVLIPKFHENLELQIEFISFGSQLAMASAFKSDAAKAPGEGVADVLKRKQLLKIATASITNVIFE